MNSFDNCIYVTLDIDWASDFILEDLISLLDEIQLPVTAFATHSYPLIDEMNGHPLFEIGLHPNFNGLLDGTSANVYLDPLLKLKEMIPEARSVRSHSLVQSSKLLERFSNIGLTHDVNLLIPAESNIELRPFTHWNGMIRVPYFWEDDVHCLSVKRNSANAWDADWYLQKSGLKVFNFHPIHIYLNTEDLGRYEASRGNHARIDELKAWKNIDIHSGARSFLINLANAAAKNGIGFGLIRDITVN